MRGTYFQGNEEHPQHISVGAVVVNDKGEVCCHHVFSRDLGGYFADLGLDDFYILMRETPEPNESLETVVHRGISEEFGITGELVDYLGSIKSEFSKSGVTIEKTTLYFLVKLVNQDVSLRRGDVESKTQLEWRTLDFLIPLMQEQTKRFGRTDLDESSILERYRLRIAQ